MKAPVELRILGLIVGSIFSLSLLLSSLNEHWQMLSLLNWGIVVTLYGYHNYSTYLKASLSGLVVSLIQLTLFIRLDVLAITQEVNKSAETVAGTTFIMLIFLGVLAHLSAVMGGISANRLEKSFRSRSKGNQ